MGFETNASTSFADGEVRDTKWIRYAGGKQVLVIAQNNRPLVFLAPAR